MANIAEHAQHVCVFVPLTVINSLQIGSAIEPRMRRVVLQESAKLERREKKKKRRAQT